MNRRLLVVLGFACVVGLVASFLVYSVIVQVARQRPGGEQEQVVVAAANMQLAETITASHIKLVAWPKSSIPAQSPFGGRSGSSTSMRETTNRRAITCVAQSP